MKKLLPAKQQLNGPSVTSMFAQSKTSVWAVGDGNREDEGGPVVVLHYNGHSWSKVGSANTGGYQNFPSVAPDGHNGLWIPLSTSAGGTIASFMHYSGGHLSLTNLPVASDKIDLQAVAGIPGTAGAIAVGFTHSATQPRLGRGGRDPPARRLISGASTADLAAVGAGLGSAPAAALSLFPDSCGPARPPAGGRPTASGC